LGEDASTYGELLNIVSDVMMMWFGAQSQILATVEPKVTRIFYVFGRFLCNTSPYCPCSSRGCMQLCIPFTHDT